MALNTGHYKTKRPEGTRNCFYCLKDVSKWEILTWPRIQELYERCGMKVPSVLICEECHKKPLDELYKVFWGSIVSIECDNYRKKKPSIIKDDATYKYFMKSLVDSGVVADAKKWIEEQGLII